MSFRISFLIILAIFSLSLRVSYAQDSGPGNLLKIADSLYNERNFDPAIEKNKAFIEYQRKNKRNSLDTICLCYENIAYCYYNLNNYDSAITWFSKALELQKKLGKYESVASTLNNIGLNYKIKGEYDKAIEYYLQAINIDQKNENQKEVGKTYNNIGMVYRAWGKYDKAIEYFERSLQLKKSLNDRAGESRSLNNIGLVYTEWKKYDQAINNFRESMKIDEEVGNISEKAIRLNNIGRVYYYMKQYDSALIYFQKSLIINQENNNKDQLALAYNNIGKVYRILGRDREAEQYMEYAYHLFDTLGMIAEKSTVLANLGEINISNGNTEHAMQLIDSSTVIATKIGLLSQLQQNYRYYSDIYSNAGDYKKSLDYYKQYTELKDSVFNKEVIDKLSDFQAKYEKEKDQARILSLEKENLKKTVQRNAFLFSGIGLVLLAFFIILYFRQRALHIRLISEQKIRQLEEEKKLMAAKLLVEGQEEERKRIATELHDGLGVLLSATRMQFSVIKDKSPENKELIERASKMLEQATGDVRKISHNMMPGLLTKLGFFEAVEDLFEHLGDTSELNVSCSITGTRKRLVENKEIMLYRIVQEMVNNTLKHAKAKNIELHVDTIPGSLFLVYSDDGVGFNMTEKLESESIGLKSIQSRVSFLNGDIDIHTKPGEGVRYELHIPN